MKTKRIVIIGVTTLLIALSIPWLVVKFIDFRCWERYGGESKFAGLEQYFAFRALCTDPSPR